MANNEQAVRDAAAAFKAALEGAAAAGYRIVWPSNVAGLDAIAISETVAVKSEPKPAALAKPAARVFGETNI